MRAGGWGEGEDLEFRGMDMEDDGRLTPMGRNVVIEEDGGPELAVTGGGNY